MIDREQLAKTYKLTAMTCAQFLFVPALMAFVAWVIVTDPEAPKDAGVISTLNLTMITLIGLTPLVIAPLIRRASRRITLPAPGPTPPLKTPIALMMFYAIGECAVWEIATLAGFVVVIAGAPWFYLAGGIALQILGLAIGFPRRSEWLARAEAIESRPPAPASAWT